MDESQKPLSPQEENPYQTATGEQMQRWLKACDEYARRCKALEDKWVWSKVLLDKRIKVLGPREFRERLGLWSASRSEYAERVPLLWELAYGGGEEVLDEQGETILSEVWFSNPVGCGWKPKGWLSALSKGKKGLPKAVRAPQLLYPKEQVEQLEIGSVPKAQTAKQMAEYVKKHERHKPANLGWTGRSWAPRLSLAGTYDEEWKEHRWPYLPKDFDFRYWNGAPEDQQIAFPEPGFCIELTNLLNRGVVTREKMTVRMPGHRAFVLAYMPSGLLLPLPMQIDTIVIDAEACQVDLVWRTGILREMEAERLEARFEVDPESPLLKVELEEEAS